MVVGHGIQVTGSTQPRPESVSQSINQSIIQSIMLLSKYAYSETESPVTFSRIRLESAEVVRD